MKLNFAEFAEKCGSCPSSEDKCSSLVKNYHKCNI